MRRQTKFFSSLYFLRVSCQCVDELFRRLGETDHISKTDIDDTCLPHRLTSCSFGPVHWCFSFSSLRYFMRTLPPPEYGLFYFSLSLSLFSPFLPSQKMGLFASSRFLRQPVPTCWKVLIYNFCIPASLNHLVLVRNRQINVARLDQKICDPADLQRPPIVTVIHCHYRTCSNLSTCPRSQYFIFS